MQINGVDPDAARGAMAYPTAWLVSQTIYERMAAHLESVSGSTEPVAVLPRPEAIASMLEMGFWTSLRSQEGRNPRLSLAFVSPVGARYPLLLEHPVRLAAEPLTRVAPAVERPGVHLGVWEEEGELRVWGATRVLPPHCFVLEVIAPGSLIVKQSPGDDSGKFVNIAVLQGDEAKIVDQSGACVPDCPDLLSSLLGLESQRLASRPVSVLIQLAISMRAHGRGGMLLIVPANTDAWRESIVHPILYSVSPPFSVLNRLMNAEPDAQNERSWQDALRRAVDAVAGLTAVDGAAIMTDRYELLAFGAKIIRRTRHPAVTRVIVTEPIENARAEIMEPPLLGGTRHLSAAQFEHDQRDAIALVASQDGRFTVFAWSPHENMVHAHRIETLLV